MGRPATDVRMDLGQSVFGPYYSRIVRIVGPLSAESRIKRRKSVCLKPLIPYNKSGTHAVTVADGAATIVCEINAK